MFDVAIIGGGLAGCSAALTLAQRQHSVVLLEAKGYPHHKVCGEFLSPECVMLFAELDFDLSALHPKPLRTTSITAPNGTSWTTVLPATAWGVSRYALDAALARHAQQHGVDVRDSTTVTDIQGNLQDGFQITTPTETFNARTVIAAHGKRSNLDRALERTFLDVPQPFIGLKNHFHNLPMSDRIELHVFQGGYCGMSEVEDDRTNVCLLVRQSIFQQRGGTIPRFIEWMQAQNPRLGERLAQAEQIEERWLSIGQVPFVRKHIVENGIPMTGDAAGLIAPLAGDGMAMALYGGQMVAHYTADYLAGKLSAQAYHQQYAQQWRKEFGTRLRLGLALQALMLRPTLITAGLHVVNIMPPLGNFLVRQTRDTRFAKGAMDD